VNLFQINHSFDILMINHDKTVAIDTPGGKRNLKMKRDY
jgi:hypothetical protein